MKTRTTTNASASSHVLKVADILDWDVPAGLKRAIDLPQDPRESRLITVRGYVRLINQSDDDCDIHIELADWPDGNASMMIIEIPHKAQAIQQTVLDLVGRQVPSAGLRLKGKEAPRIMVTGFAFMDLRHYSSIEVNDRKRARGSHGHGSDSVRTVWEVHPVLLLTKANRRPHE